MEQLTINEELLHELRQKIDMIKNVYLKGFSRLTSKDRELFMTFTEDFKTTPLESTITTGIEDLIQGKNINTGFKALVMVLGSFEGICYDMLYDLASHWIPDSNKFQDSDLEINFSLKSMTTETNNLLTGVQQWLIELALKGFNNLKRDTIETFEMTLRSLERNSETIRLSAILNGLVAEFNLFFRKREQSDAS